jgi:hypothetical protein
MNLKSYSLLAVLLVLLTGCPYQSGYILGEKTDFDSNLVGTYVLDSSKVVVENLVFKIDSNANYDLYTYSEENGKQSFKGQMVTSFIGKTKVLNLKSDDVEQYYYFKYEVKNKTLNLQFLSKNKFEIQEPNSKSQLDSAYLETSAKNKVWTFRMKLKREGLK